MIPRVAVTIVYNGLHHLMHRGFTDFMLRNFDYWAVTDGLSHPNLSTWHCNRLDLPYHSTDGTVEYLRDLSDKNGHMLFKEATGYWRSKDDQINECIKSLKREVNMGMLWQVDVDEVWDINDMREVEARLFDSPMKQASVKFNHYVGEGLIAQGEWGDGSVNRLFKWRGQKFLSHEPPKMDPYNRTLQCDDIRFDHYSYYFEKDVAFKEKYYKGYQGLLDNWKALQQYDEFPVSLDCLMPKSSMMYNENTMIVKIPKNENVPAL